MTKGMAARAYKKGGDPVAPPTGDRPCRPRGGRQAPVARWAGDKPPFFFSRDLVANLKKKNYTLGLSPYGGRPGGIFEILQNGHIFLKFLFFLNIKKKKGPGWRPFARGCQKPKSTWHAVKVKPTRTNRCGELEPAGRAGPAAGAGR